MEWKFFNMKIIMRRFRDFIKNTESVTPKAGLYKGLSADFFTLGVNKTPLIGRRGCLLHTLGL